MVGDKMSPNKGDEVKIGRLRLALTLLASVCVLQLAASTAANAGSESQNGPGVTSSTIHIGITYPDLTALRSVINVDPGNYLVAYETLIKQINAQGGINGRKVTPVFAPVNPLGTAPAATACTHLTEDDKVFAVLGFFQPADTGCYVQTHDTPIIGASLTSTQAAHAKAPWFNTVISDSDLIPKEMAIFKREGTFVGQKLGVVGTSADQQDMTVVLSVLHKMKAKVVQTAVNAAPVTDTAAQTQEYSTIASRFQSSGVTAVVAVGDSGNGWPAALQSTQSSYHPRLIASNSVTLDAYVSNKAGHSQAILKNALTAGGYPPPSLVWNDPAMKRCIARIQKAEPKAPINNPVTSASTTSMNWVAPEVACQQMALFSDFARTAGKTLNNQTLSKAASSLGHITIPGGGGSFQFPSGSGDGNGPVFVYAWNPAKDSLQLKTTAG
jgi:ABC-type branched-subunit amino acid transport system substrate-binding protein